MADEDNEVQFIDAETRTGGKERLTFREIVLSHLKKILTFSSCEFRGGFWEERANPNPQRNDPIKTYVPDTREVYSNAIEGFYDILFPHFDKEMKSDGEKLVKELKAAFKDNTITKEKDREDKTPEEGEELEQEEKRTFGNIDNRLSYRRQRVKINRKLFRALCCFLKRKDYLKGKDIADEVI